MKNFFDYNGYYKVDENGNVYSLERYVKGRTGTPKKVKGRILKSIIGSKGYRKVMLSKDNIRKTYNIHSIVANAFYGKRPENLDVAHLDGNKLNNHYLNLRYVTRKENNSHKRLHGTVPYGKRNGKHTCPESIKYGYEHHMSKLNKQQVDYILSSNMPSRKLGKLLNVSKTTILKVKNKKTYVY